MLDEKWHRRFLSMAELVSTWSKDSTKVGAVIVDPDNRHVRGIGFNGFPKGVVDFPDRYENRDTKLELIIHAEVNAIMNSNGPVNGCVLYVSPAFATPIVCPDCAKIVCQSGIKHLVQYAPEKLNETWQKRAEFTKLMFLEVGIDIIILDKKVI